MNTSSNRLRDLGAALLLVAALTACDTGTDAGATNVERSENKSSIATGKIDSSRVARDTMTSRPERQYQGARYRKDRNNDGIED